MGLSGSPSRVMAAAGGAGGGAMARAAAALAAAGYDDPILLAQEAGTDLEAFAALLLDVPRAAVPLEVVAWLQGRVGLAEAESVPRLAARRVRSRLAGVADALAAGPALARAAGSPSRATCPSGGTVVARRGWPAAGARAGGPRRARARFAATAAPGPGGPSGSHSLAARDSMEKGKWAARFAQLLADAAAPSYLAAQAADDPAAALQDLVGAARGGTVRLRVRSWESFSRWLRWNRSRAWPSGVGDVLDYLRYLEGEGCAVSVPRRFGSALRWFEERAGVEWAGEGLHGHPLVKRCLESMVERLSDPYKPVRKTPYMPYALVASLELLVCDEGQPLGVRVVAWFRCLKVYATLRQDDAQRLSPGCLELRVAGLVGRLVRTKTSGVGKRILSLPLFVPAGAWLVQSRWLATGLELLSGVMDRERDYLIPRFSMDMSEALARPASGLDLAAMGLRTLLAAKVPVLADGVWRLGEEFLLGGALAEAWTGHGERATLPSVLAAAGVAKAERDPLGRWCPEASDDYVRTYRALVGKLTMRYVGIAKGVGGEDAVDEEESFSGAKVALTLKGYEAERVAEELRALDVRCAGFLVTLKAFHGGEADGGIQDTDVEARAVELQREQETDDEGLAPTFVVVFTRRGRVARLHRFGACVHAGADCCHDTELLYDEVPNQAKYNAVCRTCWPGGVDFEECVDEGVVSGADSSSSSVTSATADGSS